MSFDIDAINALAARVRSRHCEEGGDVAAYELSRAAEELLAEVHRLTESESLREVLAEVENKRLKEELFKLARDLDAAGEAIKATAAGYRFSADAQAHLDELNRLRAENRVLKTKTTRLESELATAQGRLDDDAWEKLTKERDLLLGDNAKLATNNDALKWGWDRAEAEVTRLTEALQQSVAKECGALCKDLETDRDELERRIQAALNACDRVMLGTLSPSYLVAEVREALGWKLCPSCGPGGCAGHTKAAAEPTRHVDPGGGDCPRCNEIEQAAEGLSSTDTTGGEP